MKPTLQTAFSVIVLFTISCTKESSQNSSLVSTPSSGNSVAAHYIGEHYGGGVIFYIDSTGQHGLVADTIDLGVASWKYWTTRFTTTGATAKRIGAGKLNTRKIILSQGDSGRYAARLCKKSNRSGYGDWFLPSRDELDSLFSKKKVVGGFVSDHYWSSSEDDLINAWYVSFTIHGTNFSWTKESKGGVRAIREF